MVVSYTALARLKALSALGITKGARLMLSTPPAIIRVASPDLMARAAMPSASRPEPHRRLMVTPGTSIGRPASRDAMRATLRLSSPAWLAQP
jgi:NAD(P)H-hydrate repair Nnr-like enzyme with NAD(P)H-hydrate dehydratase domain